MLLFRSALALSKHGASGLLLFWFVPQSKADPVFLAPDKSEEWSLVSCSEAQMAEWVFVRAPKLGTFCILAIRVDHKNLKRAWERNFISWSGWWAYLAKILPWGGPSNDWVIIAPVHMGEWSLDWSIIGVKLNWSITEGHWIDQSSVLCWEMGLTICRCSWEALPMWSYPKTWFFSSSEQSVISLK